MSIAAAAAAAAAAALKAPTMEADHAADINDEELARRSIRGFGEMIAALGRCGVGAEAEIRRPNAVGARIDVAGDNPWFNGVVVPLDAAGAPPRGDEPWLPYAVWYTAGAGAGAGAATPAAEKVADEVMISRQEDEDCIMPCLGLLLATSGSGSDRDQLQAPSSTPTGADILAAAHVGTPSLQELGEINDRAYSDPGTFAKLISALEGGETRLRAYGLRDPDHDHGDDDDNPNSSSKYVCVAVTLTLGDDLNLHYVATEPSHQRRGLATKLLTAILAAATADGLIKTATLQASKDGMRMYEHLGFRQVAVLRCFVNRNALGEVKNE